VRRTIPHCRICAHISVSRSLGDGMIRIKIKSDHHAILCSLERKRDCVSTSRNGLQSAMNTLFAHASSRVVHTASQIRATSQKNLVDLVGDLTEIAFPTIAMYLWRFRGERRMRRMQQRCESSHRRE